MFLWSKLVAITLPTIVTSGTASSLLVPYLKGQSLTEWLSQIIYKKDSSKSEFDFKKLDSASDERLKKLEGWFKKLSSAEYIAKIWKKLDFARVQKLFTDIAEAEEELTKLFEKISSSLKILLSKNESIFELTKQKLEEEKESKLQQNIIKNYSLLQNALNKWEKSLSEINCVIDGEGKEETAENCKKPTSWISSIVNSAVSFTSLFSKNGSSEQNGQTSTNGESGGEKAKQELQQVKQSLLQEINKLREQNSIFQVLSANATSKEIISSVKYVYYSSLLTVLTSQQESLQELMKKDGEEADKKAKKISKQQKQLKGYYQEYSSLQRQEAIFHNWKEIFNESILRNKSNKARQVILNDRKQK